MLRWLTLLRFALLRSPFLLVALVLTAAVLLAADGGNASLDVATLISIIWGLASVILLRALPAKDGPMVLITYLSPVVICALAVFLVDGTGGWNWQKYILDVLAAYGANQGVFQGAKAVKPGLVL